MTSRCGKSLSLHLKLANVEEWQENAQGWTHRQETGVLGGCGVDGEIEVEEGLQELGVQIMD